MLEDLRGGAEGETSRGEAETLPPRDDLLRLSGVGGSGLVSSIGSVCLVKSVKGMIVCSMPANDDFELFAVVRGDLFRVGGIVCSIPASEEAEDWAVSS